MARFKKLCNYPDYGVFYFSKIENFNVPLPDLPALSKNDPALKAYYPGFNQESNLTFRGFQAIGATASFAYFYKYNRYTEEAF